MHNQWPVLRSSYVITIINKEIHAQALEKTNRWPSDTDNNNNNNKVFCRKIFFSTPLYRVVQIDQWFAYGTCTQYTSSVHYDLNVKLWHMIHLMYNMRWLCGCRLHRLNARLFRYRQICIMYIVPGAGRCVCKLFPPPLPTPPHLVAWIIDWLNRIDFILVIYIRGAWHLHNVMHWSVCKWCCSFWPFIN